MGSLAALKIVSIFIFYKDDTQTNIEEFLKGFWITVSRLFHLHIYKGVIRSFPYYSHKGNVHRSRRKMKCSLVHRMFLIFKMLFYNNYMYKWSWSPSSWSWDMWSINSFSWVSSLYLQLNWGYGISKLLLLVHHLGTCRALTLRV